MEGGWEGTLGVGEGGEAGAAGEEDGGVEGDPGEDVVADVVPDQHHCTSPSVFPARSHLPGRRTSKDEEACGGLPERAEGGPGDGDVDVVLDEEVQAPVELAPQGGVEAHPHHAHRRLQGLHPVDMKTLGRPMLRDWDWQGPIEGDEDVADAEDDDVLEVEEDALREGEGANPKAAFPSIRTLPLLPPKQGHGDCW